MPPLRHSRDHVATLGNAFLLPFFSPFLPRFDRTKRSRATRGMNNEKDRLRNFARFSMQTDAFTESWSLEENFKESLSDPSVKFSSAWGGQKDQSTSLLRNKKYFLCFKKQWNIFKIFRKPNKEKFVYPLNWGDWVNRDLNLQNV